MPAARRGPILTIGWRLHRWLYRASGGRIGATLSGWPVLLLTMAGRKTGKPSTVALNYLDDPAGMIVVGSNAGAAHPPQWFLNLLAHPTAVIQAGRRRMLVRARVAEGEERRRAWKRFVSRDSAYLEYERRTDRPIPVVILEPVTTRKKEEQQQGR